MRLLRKLYIVTLIFITIGVLTGCDKSSSVIEKARAMYSLDEDMPITILDSKRKQNGEAYNTKIVKGRIGNARRFNGRDSYIRTSLNFKGWTGLTISLWVKPESGSRNEPTIILDNGHSEKRNCALQVLPFAKGITAAKRFFVWHCPKSDASFEVPLDNWSHVILTVDITQQVLEVFLNGTLVSDRDVPEPFKFDGTPLYLGRWAVGEFRFFKGTIDEVLIWDKTLSQKEIENLHEFYSTSPG